MQWFDLPDGPGVLELDDPTVELLMLPEAEAFLWIDSETGAVLMMVEAGEA